MYHYIVNKTKFTFKYNYDEDSLLYLGNHKLTFEQKINFKIRRFFRENIDLITSESIELIIDLNKKNSEFEMSDKNDNLIIIGLNPIKLKEHDFDLVKAIDNNIPVSKWFVFMKWYGRASTFMDLFVHELRHTVDVKADVVDEYEKKMHNRGAKELLLVYFITQIRRESYPKLFDSRGTVKFEKDELDLIKENLFLAVRRDNFTKRFNEKYGYYYKGKKYSYDRDSFFHYLVPGSHHYYLAKFMSFMIAYSLMEENVTLNRSHNLKVRDMALILESGTAIIQPPKEIKEKAGAIITNCNAFKFLNEFDKACRKLSITSIQPISMRIYLRLRKELIDDFKILTGESYKHLVDRWKRKEITFVELRKLVKEMNEE